MMSYPIVFPYFPVLYSRDRGCVCLAVGQRGRRAFTDRRRCIFMPHTEIHTYRWSAPGGATDTYLGTYNNNRDKLFQKTDGVIQTTSGTGPIVYTADVSLYRDQPFWARRDSETRPHLRILTPQICPQGSWCGWAWAQ